MSGRVVVIGAINVDLAVAVPQLPQPGETVIGGELQRHFGGKGANQAVAAARAGAPVVMLGSLGDDPGSEASREDLAGEGVDVTLVTRTAGASGTALIAVAPDGRNQIVVAPGANALLAPDDVEMALSNLAIGRNDVLLASLEVPMAAVRAAVIAAAAGGATVVLNPAPALPLPSDVLQAGPIVTPNRAELRQLTGVAEVAPAAGSLLGRGARSVVVTLGEAGCAAFGPDADLALPAHAVPVVVDTTGAGDAFNGVLASWLAAGQPLPGAMLAANLAGALSVRAAGARAGMPTEHELRATLGDA
ncbi:MAG TPA: ribokinase [Candidatus Limnocylindrales bacterium]|nr:ribokinase [Candidatus Limnocylindrales bacterium]